MAQKREQTNKIFSKKVSYIVIFLEGIKVQEYGFQKKDINQMITTIKQLLSWKQDTKSQQNKRINQLNKEIYQMNQQIIKLFIQIKQKDDQNFILQKNLQKALDNHTQHKDSSFQHLSAKYSLSKGKIYACKHFFQKFNQQTQSKKNKRPLSLKSYHTKIPQDKSKVFELKIERLKKLKKAGSSQKSISLSSSFNSDFQSINSLNMTPGSESTLQASTPGCDLNKEDSRSLFSTVVV